MTSYATQLQDKLNAKKQAQEEKKKELESMSFQAALNNRVIKKLDESTQKTLTNTPSVVVDGDLATSEDIDQVIQQLKEVQLASLTANNKPNVVLADSTDLAQSVAGLSDKLDSLITAVANNSELLAKIDVLIDTVEDLSQRTVPTNNDDVVNAISQLKKSVDSKDYTPTITVEPPKIKMPKIELPSEEKGINLLDYKAQDLQEPVEGVQYAGFVSASGDWYIQRNYEDQGTSRYVFGSGNYSDNFARREAFEYKTLDIAVMEWRDETTA